MTGNILKSTERFLKRCLKGKAAITTAMVVTFMMTGAVATAETTVITEPTKGSGPTELREIAEDEHIYADVDNNWTSSEAYAVKVDSNKAFVNNGIIEIEGTSRADENSNGQAIRGVTGSTGSVITNNGTIIVTDYDEEKGEARGIHIGTNGKAYNHGVIDVTGYKARGIVAGSDNSYAVNEEDGLIIVDGLESRGMYADKNSTVENNGTIETYGEKSTGVWVKNGSSATNSGTITTKGEGSTGIRLENGNGTGADFTNEATGKIVVEGSGTAIRMDEGTTFTNEGTVKVSADAKVFNDGVIIEDGDGGYTIAEEYNVTNEGIVVKEFNDVLREEYDSDADTIAVDRSGDEPVAYKQVGEDVYKATEVDGNGELVWTLADPTDLPVDPVPADPTDPEDPAVPTPTNPNGECAIENADVYSSFLRYTVDVVDMVNDNIRLNGVNKDQGVYAGINGGHLSGDDYDFNLYGGYVGYNFDKGRGIAISMGETDGEFSAGDTSRDDKYYQLNAYVTHDLNGFTLFNNAFIGLTDSELENHDDTKSYYIGTNTEISKRHDFNSFYMRPKAELNIMYIDQDSMENKECSVEEQEEWLLQVGVGSAIGKDFNSKLRVEAEAMVYMDIIDSYEDLDVTSHSNGTLTTINAYDENVFHGKIGINGVYESNSITVSTGVSYDIAEDNDFHVGGGLSYKF